MLSQPYDIEIVALPGGESWREMVREAVGTNDMLQLDLVRQLYSMNENMEALYWAQAYDIPKGQWPWGLSELDDARSSNGKISRLSLAI